MPFKKGEGGRKPGTRNKTSTEIGQFCRRLLEDEKYRKYFMHRLEVGQLPSALEAMVWAYAYGKPQESLDLTGEIAVNTRVTHVHEQ